MESTNMEMDLNRKPGGFPNETVEFEKEHPTDKVWWVYRIPQEFGPLEISFDKKKIYNLWQDYPDNMTPDEVEIFDKENPFWADAFKDRKENP